MTDIKREIERKYESDAGVLPDLTGADGVAAVLDRGVAELDAVYYDTADERLAAAGITLRRRTGGSDAGWHLKFPVAPGVRDEIHAPLSDTVPAALAALVRSRVRRQELLPLVRIRTRRTLRHLVDADGTLLAEAAVDEVRAERPAGGGRTARWTEIEVELADGGDPALLDKVEKRLRKAGVRRSPSSSKLARALAATAGPDRRPGPPEEQTPVTAGDHVLACLRAQRDALVALDPAVRRGVPDSVHRMRVAARRLRSVLRTYREVLDRSATDPLREELRRLGGELGLERDQEVLDERLTAGLDALPDALVTGPVRDRLRTWSRTRRSALRGRAVAALDSRRHLELLDALDALLADPPLRPAAAKRPAKVMTRAVRKQCAKLSALLEQALALPPGPERDLALHEARKQAKAVRYTAEAAVPALGAPAAGLVRTLKALQDLLGRHQDSVMARRALRELADQAHAEGENAFTYGVLHGREEQRAAEYEAKLPGLWEAAVAGHADSRPV
ncbi:CYTH and CHAD domain-containing protein [Streptomyces sp. LB8]|uniref:CYTH and CHAD domain-containing protein n=1 Tax=Streptomyces sp. LB8 TaxID=3042509 RepID=UPI0026479036|nr:CYTH and CHAD domain-containing protein [Streptomyces sp. LB8]MDN5384551.1 CYTH and CHAD domain-containing protein [Streptomyces sp. LB8]